MPDKRSAGILLPITCLPGRYGCGTFGQEAYSFIDFLHGAGQSYWQVLPLGPTGYGDSPYQSDSAFAGNPLLIDLTLLQQQGLLTEQDCETAEVFNTGLADFTQLAVSRLRLLKIAFNRFTDWRALASFKAQHAHWLGDYTLYSAVKQRLGNVSWLAWPEDIRLRKPDALRAYSAALAREIEFTCFVQYLFYSQWHALRAYANEHNVAFIGDIPIYVSLDSADVWAAPEHFELDANHLPIEVAGCPPDGFSATGQLWGNPLYNWPRLQQDGYSWWKRRMRACFELFDITRIDHFRGFESYYAIPYGATTAIEGRWREGPGIDFINAIKADLPYANIIAEDLGFLTDGVRQLLAQSGFPGMKVLQFAFDPREESDYRPHLYPQNCVAYTGTHDNDTVLGWAQAAPNEAVEYAMEYLGAVTVADLPAAFIRGVYQSAAKLAVVPLQDWLGLGSEARINVPSTLGGQNWRWRLRQMPTSQLQARMLRATAMYGRTSSAPTQNPENIGVA